MSEGKDDRIGELLRATAPPQRDPVFRLKVLERREHRQFQRRLLTMFVGTLVIILVSASALSSGGRAVEPTGALVVGAALASTYLAFRPRVLRILKRFSI
jgi:hypothetical protein